MALGNRVWWCLLGALEGHAREVGAMIAHATFATWQRSTIKPCSHHRFETIVINAQAQASPCSLA